METLIELFDERPFENIIGTETFQPRRTVYICAPEVKKDTVIQQKLKEYYACRGIHSECIFEEAAVMNADNVASVLRKILDTYDDCVLDITGGTEAALFAAGLVCCGNRVPVITYSLRRNAFFNVRDAHFREMLPCRVTVSVKDVFLMAGGTLRKGRVENSLLSKYEDRIAPFFQLFMDYRRQWKDIVAYMQKISKNRPGETPPLRVEGPMEIKTERGRKTRIDSDVLRRLESIGMIRELVLEKEKVTFCFTDQQTRTWLRDVGSVLELYVYQKAREAGLYHDVVTSAVVDWESSVRSDRVTNEIDVMATKGVTSFFISCKVCDVKTEALNELAILRDRFGGHMARAAIVTAETARTPTRHRAEELNIHVIDLNDLKKDRLIERLKALAQ